MGSPRVSIIIPVYKAEKHLRRGLDSILHQTDTRWEALCIDDGSPDNSGAILEEYAKKDPRFRIFHQENAGVSVARNRGINEARGSFITFLDADDRLSEKTVATIILHADHETTDIIIFDTKLEYEPGIPRNVAQENNLKVTENRRFHASPEGIKASIGTCWAKAYRREMLLLYDVRFPIGMRQEDEVFYRCSMAVAREIELVAYTGYYYLQADGSFMHSGQTACDTYLLYVKGMEHVHSFYKRHQLLPAWEESLLIFLSDYLSYVQRMVSPAELRIMRRETTAFLNKTDIPTHFRHDYRLRYITSRTRLRDIFIHRMREGEIYGIGSIGLLKIRYQRATGRYERCVTPLSKLASLLSKR